MLWIVLLLQASGGTVEVRTDEGVEVFLDGASKGRTTKDPFRLERVAAGKHALKLVKAGHHSQEIEVVVEEGKVVTPTLRPFKPMPGEIVIKTEAGVDVFLDGDGRGTTRDQPFVIARVEPGKRRLKLQRAGYAALEFEVIVEPGQTLEPRIGPWTADVKITDGEAEPSHSVKGKTGWLIVKSLPVECEISCEALGISKIRKSAARWTATQVPPGKYTFEFSASGKTAKHDVEFKAGGKSVLMAYVEEGRVTENLGEILVKGETGVDVFVDEQTKGTTTQDGLLVRDVTPGLRKVRVRKFGYKPVEHTVSVEIGKTAEQRVSAYDFKPEVLVFEDGKEPEGASRMWKLVVRSLPTECTVDCYDLGLQKAAKSKERWVAYGAIEKRFSFTFAGTGGSVYQDIPLSVGKTTHVMVYLAERRVEIDKGDLHVRTGAGVAIFVDGKERGATAENGLVVRDLAPGRHVLRAVKPDFHPQETTVDVAAGETIAHACPTFKPILQITESDEAPDPKLASRAVLFLQTRPASCLIDCEDLGLEKSPKSADAWIGYGFPDGAYEIVFTSGEKRITHPVHFRAGRRVRLGVDFTAGTVTSLPPTPADFAKVAEFRVHPSQIVACRISPDSRYAVSVAKDPYLRIWDVAAGTVFDTFPTGAEVFDVAFSSDGKFLYALTGEGIVVWELGRRKRIRLIPFPQGEWSRKCFVAKNTLALLMHLKGGRANGIRLMDTTTWKEIRTIVVPDTIDAAALGPDGLTFAVGLHDGRVRFWTSDGKEGTELLALHKAAVNCLAFRPDGKVLVSGSGDQTARIWDLATGRVVKNIAVKNRVLSAAWSPDGKHVGTTDDSGSVIVWSAATGKSVRAMDHHNGEVRGFAYGSDGKTLVSGGTSSAKATLPGETSVSFCIYRMLE